jgi:flagellar basal body rod protein FlgG
MNSQLYTAASGLLAEGQRVEMIANNLANLSTSGFRAQRSFQEVFRGLWDSADVMPRPGNRGVALAGTYETPNAGAPRPTGRALDLALRDKLLAVQTPAGRRYTRSGELQVTADGQLVDGGKRPVLDASGRPIDGLSARAELTASGAVRDGGAERAKLLVVSDPQRVLRHEGQNLLTADGKDAALEVAKEPELQPGAVDGSGADALGELIQLIQSQRAFESYQRLIHTTMNEINRRAVTDLAR